MEAVGGSGQRIGAAERDEAVEALRTHLEAGRLTPEEYEDRSVTASGARTVDDLVPLFADLPEPRPAPVAARTVSAPGTGAGLPALSDGARERIMAVIPLVALVMFFVTRTWLWFLAIPIAAALLYGNDRKGRKGH
jgi:hypothetical protein